MYLVLPLPQLQGLNHTDQQHCFCQAQFNYKVLHSCLHSVPFKQGLRLTGLQYLLPG